MTQVENSKQYDEVKQIFGAWDLVLMKIAQIQSWVPLRLTDVTGSGQVGDLTPARKVLPKGGKPHSRLSLPAKRSNLRVEWDSVTHRHTSAEILFSC